MLVATVLGVAAIGAALWLTGQSSSGGGASGRDEVDDTAGQPTVEIQIADTDIIGQFLPSGPQVGAGWIEVAREEVDASRLEGTPTGTCPVDGAGRTASASVLLQKVRAVDIDQLVILAAELYPDEAGAIAAAALFVTPPIIECMRVAMDAQLPAIANVDVVALPLTVAPPEGAELNGFSLQISVPRQSEVGYLAVAVLRRGRSIGIVVHVVSPLAPGPDTLDRLVAVLDDRIVPTLERLDG